MVQNKFFEEVKKSLNDAIGEEIDEKLIEIPPDSKLGDYAFPCFSLAKKFKKAPQMIATELKDKIKFNENLISEIKTIGPYINFFINKKEFSKNILNEINDKKEKYASEDNKDYTVMIESPGPNTNKPLHLGHVRNMLLGNSIQNIYNFLGYKTVHVDIVNNRGVHICKSMLAYHKFGNNSEPDKKPDHFVGDYYVKYAKAEKEHPEMEEEIQEMLKKWEENDPETRALWQKMNDWCLVGMKTTYDRYGVKMDKPYYESEHYVKGRDIALNALKNGIFEKNEKGDIIVDFEKETQRIVTDAKEKGFETLF